MAEEAPANAREQLELKEIAGQGARYARVVEPDPAIGLSHQSQRQLTPRAFRPLGTADQSLIVACGVDFSLGSV